MRSPAPPDSSGASSHRADPQARRCLRSRTGGNKSTRCERIDPCPSAFDPHNHKGHSSHFLVKRNVFGCHLMRPHTVTVIRHHQRRAYRRARTLLNFTYAFPRDHLPFYYNGGTHDVNNANLRRYNAPSARSVVATVNVANGSSSFANRARSDWPVVRVMHSVIGWSTDHPSYAPRSNRRYCADSAIDNA